MKKLSIAVVAAAAALTAPAANSTTPYSVEGNYTFKIEGFVPVICRATVNSSNVSPQDGAVQLGIMSEFCNNASGYEVWAEHSDSLAGSTLVVDGREIQLSDSGTTLVSQSGSAAVANRQLALNLADGVSSGSLSIRINPL